MDIDSRAEPFKVSVSHRLTSGIYNPPPPARRSNVPTAINSYQTLGAYPPRVTHPTSSFPYHYRGTSPLFLLNTCLEVHVTLSTRPGVRPNLTSLDPGQLSHHCYLLPLPPMFNGTGPHLHASDVARKERFTSGQTHFYQPSRSLQAEVTGSIQGLWDG